MKVFVAGATGAVGKRLVPLLVARGHSVVGLTRTPEKAELLRTMGAEPAVADALDRDAVMEAVTRARPDGLIHQLTALSGIKGFRRFDRDFALSNRLRTDGIDHLIRAALAVGARRLVAQSYGNWNYERTGDGLKTEDDPLDPNPPRNQAKSLEAIRYLEQAVTGTDGIDGLAL